MSPTLQIRQLQQDFSSGEVLDVAPHLIDNRGLQRARNGIYRDDGSVRRRGGTKYASAAFGTGGLRWLWTGYFDEGPRVIAANATDFGVLDVDDNSWVNLGGSGLAVPASAAKVQGMLFIAPGYIYGGSRKSTSYTTGTISLTNGSKSVIGTGTTWTTMIDVGSLIQVGNERVYVVEAIADNTHLTLRDAYEGSTAAGVSYTSWPLYAIIDADPYIASEHYAFSNERLLVTDEGVVRFSEQFKPHSFLPNDYHELPEGQQAIGLCSIGHNVLVFATAGVWLLGNLAADIVDATGTPQHTFEMLSRELRLWEEAGIAYWGQAAVIPTTAGVYLMDGVSVPIPVSRTIDPLLELYNASGYQPGGAVVYRNHYFMPIIDSTGLVQEVRVCRLDRGRTDPQRGRVFPWSGFDGTGGAMVAFAVKALTDAEPSLLGAGEDGRLHNAAAYVRPGGAYKSDADGSNHQLAVITRDFTLAELAEAVLRFVRPWYELIPVGADVATVGFDWSEGSLASSDGDALWNEVTWDDFDWADLDEGATFYHLPPEAGRFDGTGRPPRRRIGKRLRHVRFRMTSDGPSAVCILRGVELFIRPPGSARR